MGGQQIGCDSMTIHLFAQTDKGQRGTPGPRTARYLRNSGITQGHIIGGQKAKNYLDEWLANPVNNCPDFTEEPIYANVEDRLWLVHNPDDYVGILTHIGDKRITADVWAQVLAEKINEGKMDYMQDLYVGPHGNRPVAVLFAYYGSLLGKGHQKKRDAIARLRSWGYEIAIGLWCRDPLNKTRRLWPRHQRREIRFAVQHGDHQFVWTKDGIKDDRHNKRLLRVLDGEAATV